MKRTILLYGTSANPPTDEGGHGALVRWAATRPRFPEIGGPIDAVWVLPVYAHVFDKRLAPFEHRLAMARLAFERPGPGVPVEVLDVEREVSEARGGRPGTLDVVEALEADYPETRFALLLGADTARDLLEGKWKRSASILARIPIVVIPRPNEAFDGAGRLFPASDAPQTQPVSSTGARDATGAELLKLVRPEVADYMMRHRLYAYADRI